MASTTRGSIKISTANGIGAALVDVLGGEGYKPDEWEENINLCGIHAADIESALENIEEDAGTGTERGSILLSTANAIGAVLNKKFNTSRGFSPREWASAASKLEPLPERTSSGAIANITDGADGVPLKNWLVTLPASLDGYTEVNGKQSGKNLLPDTNYMTNYFSVATNGVVSQITTGAPYAWSYANCIFKTTLPAGTYTAIEELVTDATNSSHGVQVFNSSNVCITRVSGGAKTAGVYSSTFTLSEKTDLGIVCKLYDGTAKLYIVCGSTATAYEPYTAPEVSEVDLGRTIYGGTADIVTGEGEDENGNTFTFTPITPTPETALGVNNFWADEGDSAVTYRKDLDIPDPVPGNLLGMNNGNNNEEESEG